MLISRVVSRSTRSVSQRGLLRLVSPSEKQLPVPPLLSGQYYSPVHNDPNQFVASQVSLFHYSAHSASPFGRFSFSSSANPAPKENEGSAAENTGASVNAEAEKTDGDVKDSVPAETEEASGSSSETEPSVRRRRRGTKRTAFSDSDSEVESDLSMEDLVKLLKEKEELLKSKNKEMEVMQDKVLRGYAEMENVMDRTRREAENSKKFAIQNFAKSLLDVADNLERASSVVKESFSKVDVSKDTAGVVPLLKTLLEGVEMTEKQLAEIFKKFGVERFYPMNEPFDPNKHNASYEAPDASKPPGTVFCVWKAGYMLHDRVIRPAEVGVTRAADSEGVKE